MIARLRLSVDHIPVEERQVEVRPGWQHVLSFSPKEIVGKYISPAADIRLEIEFSATEAAS